jgi:prolyl oligopeptidase PreP (S9A serine peptidase family)
MMAALRNVLNPIIILLAVFSLDTFAQTRPAKVAGETWSDYLQFIEKNPTEKDRIFHQEMFVTNAQYSTSKNRQAIEALIRTRGSGATTIQKATLKSGEILKLIDNGLGKSIDLVQEGSSSKVLYSNFQMKRNNTIGFTGFSVSPQEDYALIFAEQNGSIDDYQIIPIDLRKSQIIPGMIMASGSGKSVRVSWTGNSTFFYRGVTDKLGYKIDLSAPVAPVPTNGLSYFGKYPRNLECGHSGVQYVNSTQSEPVKIKLENTSCEWVSLLGFSNQHMDLLVSEPQHEEHLKIIRYNLNENKTSIAGTQILDIHNQVYDSVSVFDSKYFIQTHWGKTQSLLTIDMLTGQLIDQFELPDCASIKSISSAVKNKSLNVTLNTFVSTDRLFVYDYMAHTWATAPDREGLLKDSDGNEYVSEVLEAPSDDGTLIPFRLTYLKSTVLGENTPFLFKVYGGYDESGGFYPQFNYLIRNLFIRKGGVLVTAALRGGNEFGEGWHDQASVLKRMTTFFDLIAISKYVIGQKWTSRSRIIVTGTSAGGLVTLASGMLSPESFGLLVPVSPPTDILGKIRLDSRFYQVQKKEYGDPAFPEVLDYMKKYSPLEQDFTADRLPQILLIAGLNDSRVNPEHSFKLIEKFRENNVGIEKLNVLMINNSGHWLEDIGFQDLIAWRANSVMWDQIYSFLKW